MLRACPVSWACLEQDLFSLEVSHCGALRRWEMFWGGIALIKLSSCTLKAVWDKMAMVILFNLKVKQGSSYFDYSEAVNQCL